MLRLVAVCAIAAFLCAPAFAQKAPPTKAPPQGPLEQHDAAAQQILDTCAQVFTVDNLSDLENLRGDLLDESVGANGRADHEHNLAAEAYLDAFLAYRGARHATFKAIMDLAMSMKDAALLETAQAEDRKPMLSEDIASAIDAFAGEGVAEAIESPALVGIVLASEVLDSRVANERAAKAVLVRARQAVRALEAELEVIDMIWIGVRECLTDQEDYLAAKMENTPVAPGADLPEVGHSRMDQYFIGDPALSFEIPPDVNADIPYTFVGCQARCEGDAACVAWSYIYPADTSANQPALCEIYDTADDIAESGHGASFSGYGPKAVELGLARPFDGYD
jgi:hypothetical protein